MAGTTAPPRGDTGNTQRRMLPVSCFLFLLPPVVDKKSAVFYLWVVVALVELQQQQQRMLVRRSWSHRAEPQPWWTVRGQ